MNQPFIWEMVEWAPISLSTCAAKIFVVVQWCLFQKDLPITGLLPVALSWCHFRLSIPCIGSVGLSCIFENGPVGIQESFTNQWMFHQPMDASPTNGCVLLKQFESTSQDQSVVLDRGVSMWRTNLGSGELSTGS